MMYFANKVKKLVLLSNTPGALLEVFKMYDVEVLPFASRQIKHWEDFLAQAKNFFGDYPAYGFVYNFGKIIPEKVLQKIRLINIHYSLLPKYRGADPLTAALINGDESTGITLHWTVKDLDAGNILLQKKYKIPEDANRTTLFAFLESKLSEVFSEFFSTPDIWQQVGQPQVGEPSYVFKYSKNQAYISFANLTAREIVNRVRAFNNTPGAWGHVYFCNKNSCKGINVRKLISLSKSSDQGGRGDSIQFGRDNFGQEVTSVGQNGAGGGKVRVSFVQNAVDVGKNINIKNSRGTVRFGHDTIEGGQDSEVGQDNIFSVREFRIKQVRLFNYDLPLKPGQILWHKKHGLIVGTLYGNIHILKGALAGKKDLELLQFLSLKGKLLYFK